MPEACLLWSHVATGILEIKIEDQNVGNSLLQIGVRVPVVDEGIDRVLAPHQSCGLRRAVSSWGTPGDSEEPLPTLGLWLALKLVIYGGRGLCVLPHP